VEVACDHIARVRPEIEAAKLPDWFAIVTDQLGPKGVVSGEETTLTGACEVYNLEPGDSRASCLQVHSQDLDVLHTVGGISLSRSVGIEKESAKIRNGAELIGLARLDLAK